MTVYSINDLEKLTGIKAHTLRIWEQRYGIIEPQRTATNIRYYTDTELRKLLNISILNKNGYKISKIAKMSEQVIASHIEKFTKDTDDQVTKIDTIAIAMMEMDELRFDEIVNTSIEKIGFDETMQELIFPFLDKINLLYITGSIKPAQEHFITNLIRQKIVAAIDKIPLAKHLKTKKFLIFLPDQEKQELSLTYLHYLLKSRGVWVVNAGSNLVPKEAAVPYDLHKPDFVYIMFNEPHKQHIQKRVDEFAVVFPKSTVLISGYQIATNPIKLPKNAKILRNLAETLLFLQGLLES